MAEPRKECGHKRSVQCDCLTTDKNPEGSFFDFVERERGEFVLALAKGDFQGGFNRAMDKARQWGHNRAEELK